MHKEASKEAYKCIVNIIIKYLIYMYRITYDQCSVTQLCLTLCSPMDYGLPGSSNHGILQASILEWVGTSSSRRSSQPRD